jgi:hypothetical protein
MLASELGDPFLRHFEDMKYATSQKALQRLEQEYLARLSPSQADEVRRCVVEVHNTGKERLKIQQGSAIIETARTVDFVLPDRSFTR